MWPVSLCTAATSCGFGLHSSALLGSEMLIHWLVAWHRRIPSLELQRRHRLRCLALSASRRRRLEGAPVAVGIVAVQGILSLQLECPGMPFLRGRADCQQVRPTSLSTSIKFGFIWIHLAFWLEPLLHCSNSSSIRPLKRQLCSTHQVHL